MSHTADSFVPGRVALRAESRRILAAVAHALLFVATAPAARATHQVVPSGPQTRIAPVPWTNAWQASSPLPSSARRYGFAQDGDTFFVLTTSALHRYDATTDTWTSSSPAPRPLQLPGVVHHQGKLYVAGGMDDGPTNELFVLDLSTMTWSQGPSMPVFSYGSAAGLHGGKMFVVTGTSGQSLAIYDIAGNSWSLGPSPPVAYRIGGHAQSGSFLYLIGGLTSTTSTASRRLDMATQTWSLGPTWTPARGDFALVAVGSKLYGLGGRVWNESAPSAQMNELDLTAWPAGAWTRRLPDLPSARLSNQAGFVSGARIWSTGGLGAGSVPILEHVYLDL